MLIIYRRKSELARLLGILFFLVLVIYCIRFDVKLEKPGNQMP